MNAEGFRSIVKWATRSRASPRRPAPVRDKTATKERSLRKRKSARLLFESVAPLNSQTLVFPDANIGIVWSPKSACTKVVLWYFKLVGLLEAAAFYHKWPHSYRMNVLYSSQQYIKWMQNSDWKSFTWYQFYRDPVKRLLSSYRHNLGHGYADDRISQALGKKVTFLDGYSLEDFLRYLDTQDLGGACDPHVKMQWHPVADYVEIKTINIDEVDMLEHMNAIERGHGLPITDFTSIPAFQRDDRRRVRFGTPEQFSATRVLTKKDAKGIWPLEASVLDVPTAERIKQMYARDMTFFSDTSRSMILPQSKPKVRHAAPLSAGPGREQ